MGSLRRLGNLGDGGYVVWVDDDAAAGIIKGYDLYISAGVGAEESFTWDFLMAYGGGGGAAAGTATPQAWAFDGTVAEFPRQYIPKGARVIFVQRNIGAEMTATTVNLHRLLDTHREVFLKMDIEGAEYEWLAGLSCDLMGHIRQMVIEFHDINRGELFSAAWEKVQRTHWVVHIHGNNYGGVRACDGRPNVIEVTLLRKGAGGADTYVSEKDIVIFPVCGLDWPNCRGRPDVWYGGGGGAYACARPL